MAQAWRGLVLWPQGSNRQQQGSNRAAAGQQQGNKRAATGQHGATKGQQQGRHARRSHAACPSTGPSIQAVAAQHQVEWRLRGGGGGGRVAPLQRGCAAHRAAAVPRGVALREALQRGAATVAEQHQDCEHRFYPAVKSNNTFESRREPPCARAPGVQMIRMDAERGLAFQRVSRGPEFAILSVWLAGTRRNGSSRRELT
eukprot:gene7048-biopygen15030